MIIGEGFKQSDFVRFQNFPINLFYFLKLSLLRRRKDRSFLFNNNTNIQVCEYDVQSYPTSLVDTVLKTYEQEMQILLKYANPAMLKVNKIIIEIVVV